MINCTSLLYMFTVFYLKKRKIDYVANRINLGLAFDNWSGLLTSFLFWEVSQTGTLTLGSRENQ